jgi:preflagellin peptidase FlaK
MITELVAASLLSILSIHDVRKRELPEKLTLLSLLIVLTLRILEGLDLNNKAILPLKAYMIFDVIIVMALSILAHIGSLGWGDVIASIIIVLASPYPTCHVRFLPPILVTIVFYIIIIIIYSLALAIYNITMKKHQIAKLPLKYRLIYMFIAKPIKVKDIINGKLKWWYPLSLCGEYKLTFNIYLNPDDVYRDVKKAISKGCIKPNDEIWATYGIPAIPLLTASYVLSLLLGDTILLKLIFPHLLAG